jgi:dTDP-4-dehydrorhamnose 3,5-epimerase
METYSEKDFKAAGIEATFVQDNHAMSVTKGVLRGLHFQNPEDTQAKLVRVIKGAVYDVIVDLRKDSETYGKWEGFELTAKNFYMLFVPRGFAHGYCTLEDYTEFVYKTDNFYAPQNEGGIVWNDPDLKIYWPIENPILSEKDKKLPLFKDINSPF